MKFYIIKPSSSKIDDDLIKGLRSLDAAAIFIDDIKEADKCVLQKGWTKSKLAVSKYHMAKENHIQCDEGYLYTDKYKVHLN